MINVIEVKTRIGKRFSLIIPKDIREKIGLKEGDLVTIRKEKNVIIIIPEKVSPFKKLSNLIGDIKYDEKAEEDVEKFLSKSF